MKEFLNKINLYFYAAVLLSPAIFSLLAVKLPKLCVWVSSHTSYMWSSTGWGEDSKPAHWAAFVLLCFSHRPYNFYRLSGVQWGYMLSFMSSFTACIPNVSIAPKGHHTKYSPVHKRLIFSVVGIIRGASKCLLSKRLTTWLHYKCATKHTVFEHTNAVIAIYTNNIGCVVRAHRNQSTQWVDRMVAAYRR